MTSHHDDEDEPQGAKACRVCRKTKPLDHFRRDPRCLDGHRAVCLDCRHNPAATTRGATHVRPAGIRETTYCDGSITDPHHAAQVLATTRARVTTLTALGAHAEAVELAFQALDAMGAALTTTPEGCATLADTGRLAYSLLGPRHAAYMAPDVCRQRPYGPALQALLSGHQQGHERYAVEVESPYVADSRVRGLEGAAPATPLEEGEYEKPDEAEGDQPAHESEYDFHLGPS